MKENSRAELKRADKACARVFHMEHSTCRKCGASPVEMHHILSRKMYASVRHAGWNLMPLCKTCHDQATGNTLTWQAWIRAERIEIERMKQVARREAIDYTYWADLWEARLKELEGMM